METYAEQQERIAQKIANASWPSDVPKPSTKPRLKLVGIDGNAFVVLGAAKKAADRAEWTSEQTAAFMKLAKAGDYEHLLGTCMDFFDVR